MFNKLSLSVTSLMLVFATAFAQDGTLKGRVSDKDNGEGLAFANVIIELNGKQMGGTTTDFDGNYTIKPISPGEYEVKTTYIGYNNNQSYVVQKVIIKSDQITYVNMEISKGIVLDDVVIYGIPLIEAGKTSTGATLTREDILAAPTRNISSIASTTAGVYQSDEGDGLNVKGQRDDGTLYMIDGIPVRSGSALIPTQGIEQISIITGGLSAKYGDVTGGVINLSTRGPSLKHMGSVLLESSQLTDAYGNNLLGGNLSGPLYTYKKGTEEEKALSGFFISAEASYIKDSDPSAIGIWKVKDEKLAELEKSPLTPSSTGTGFLRSAEFVTKNDLEKVKAKQNVDEKSISISSKIDYTPTKNITLTLGATYDYSNSDLYSRSFSLFNIANNGNFSLTTWRSYAKFKQVFPSTDSAIVADDGSTVKSTATIKNAYYVFQVDYSGFNEKYQGVHGKKLFDYGYNGAYQTFKAPVYTYGTDSLTGYSGWIQQAFQDTLVTFQRAEVNPLVANYTDQYYKLSGYDPNNPYLNKTDKWEDKNQIQQNGGILNGEFITTTQHIYSLYHNTGAVYNDYFYSDRRQFRLSTYASADVKDHAIEFGVVYEQRTDYAWDMNPVGLWGLMRQLTNKHITDLDKDNPNLIYSGPTFGPQDTINYNRKYVASSQSEFDKNLRQSLGLPVDGTTWIDIDNLTPDKFSLDMFSAEELLQNGAGVLNFYYGYDYLGNKLKKKPTLDDFFNNTKEMPIAPFQPIYIAGYVQDVFDFKDLKFNIGIRVDRFDANQSVLKDKYSIYDLKTVGEVREEKKFQNVPEIIEDDYKVYVDDVSNPTKILGYRNEDTWYDAEGNEISNPAVIATKTTTGTIAPYLSSNVENDSKTGKPKISTASFKDYKPQTTFMPRIAFTFPISDQAQFFAHYDVLSQRPPSGVRIHPINYLYMEQVAVNNTLNNPDLKPERTIDYQVGFEQVLTPTSVLKLSAFYRELKDMIQVVKLNYAYPVDYRTFGNIDFGTVKGFEISYDLRRTGNAKLTVSYTLQFADGTGSSTTSALNLINSDQPNLRTLMPLSFDQRHSIVTTFDYHYSSGSSYDGPRWFGKNIFENTGANLIFRVGSGTPYTRQANPTPEAQFGIANRTRIQGTLNGSRLPWQFRVDAKFDRIIKLKIGKDENDNPKKILNFNAYLVIQNLLNTKNVVGIYSATGNQDDDGYLASAVGLEDIARQTDPDAFYDLYLIKINNPDHYSIPRRIRLGLIYNF